MPYKQRVGGSNPSAPTEKNGTYSTECAPFLFAVRSDYLPSNSALIILKMSVFSMMPLKL